MYRSWILRPSFWFPCALIVLFLSAWRASTSFPGEGRYFPVVIAVVGIISSLLSLIQGPAVDERAARTTRAPIADPQGDVAMGTATGYRRLLQYVGWIVAYYALMMAAGAAIGMAAFLLGFLRVEGRAPWWVAGLISVTVTAVLAVLLVGLLGLSVPPGVVGDPLALRRWMTWR